MAYKTPDDVPGQPSDDELPRVPPPGRWADVMDELIEDAMRAGAFDNLPGHGKPLNLHNNPHAPGTELAYQLLKDNNYTLPWISERQVILADIQALRTDINRTWRSYSAEFQVAQSELVQLALVSGWHKRQEDWGERIKQLNKRIGDLNLKQPGESFEVIKLTLKGELDRAGASDDLTRLGG